MYLTDPPGRVARTKALGRFTQGEDRPNHILTRDAVQLIRRSNEPARDLAARFGVLPATIKDARYWRSWRNPPATDTTVR